MEIMAAKERELERILKALANQRRLLIVAHLKRKNTGIAVSDVAEHMKLSFKATSKHLMILAEAGIIEKEQISKLMLSRISPTMPKPARLMVDLL